MVRFFPSAGDSSARLMHLGLRSSVSLFPLLALPLLLGLVSGSFIGLFSSETAPFLDSFNSGALSGDFFAALLHALRFVLLALLFSTSFAGVFVLPVLSALRGFLLGCSVAAAFHAEAFRGLLLAFFSFGIPALLGLPAFLVASEDGAALSLLLLRFLTRGERRISGRGGDVPKHVLIVLLLCLVQALYSRFLLPLLVTSVL